MIPRKAQLRLGEKLRKKGFLTRNDIRAEMGEPPVKPYEDTIVVRKRTFVEKITSLDFKNCWEVLDDGKA